jgi:hypothetical protein
MRGLSGLVLAIVALAVSPQGQRDLFLGSLTLPAVGRFHCD